MKFHFAFARHSRESGNPALAVDVIAVPLPTADWLFNAGIQHFVGKARSMAGFPLSRE
jgi:hypothetical protein